MLRTLVKHRIPAQSTGHVCQGSFTKRPVLFHAFHAQTSALKRSTWLRVDKRSIDLSTGRIHKRNESGRPVKSPQYICPTDCTKARFHRALSVTARRHRNQDHSPERHFSSLMREFIRAPEPGRATTWVLKGQNSRGWYGELALRRLISSRKGQFRWRNP